MKLKKTHNRLTIENKMCSSNMCLQHIWYYVLPFPVIRMDARLYLPSNFCVVYVWCVVAFSRSRKDDLKKMLVVSNIHCFFLFQFFMTILLRIRMEGLQWKKKHLANDRWSQSQLICFSSDSDRSRKQIVHQNRNLSTLYVFLILWLYFST